MNIETFLRTAFLLFYRTPPVAVSEDSSRLTRFTSLKMSFLITNNLLLFHYLPKK